jgi:NADH dehydrogenase/NADH:ubiquinone oxidoreductase subunit G
MEKSPKQVNVTIDGLQFSVPEGMTILEAARKNNIRIPTLCHHPGLSAWGGCRLCVVEVDGSPKLAASCVMPVRDGMAIVTNNANILTARRTILEFIFAERNHNCMFCSQSGLRAAGPGLRAANGPPHRAAVLRRLSRGRHQRIHGHRP